MQNKKNKISYDVFTLRISEENKNWLKTESKNYKSWNLFIRELIKIYTKGKRRFSTKAEYEIKNKKHL